MGANRARETDYTFDSDATVVVEHGIVDSRGEGDGAFRIAAWVREDNGIVFGRYAEVWDDSDILVRILGA